MSQFKDLKDPITSALMYAELGMEDSQIAQELKEDEGIEDEKTIEFILKTKKIIIEEFLKHADKINEIVDELVEKENEEELDNKVIEYLKGQGVDAELVELVKDQAILSIGIKEGEDIISQLVTAGATEKQIMEKLKEMEVDESMAGVMYSRVIDRMGDDVVVKKSNMRGYVHLIYGIIILGGGIWAASDIGEDMIYFITIAAGLGFIASGIYKLSR